MDAGALCALTSRALWRRIRQVGSDWRNAVPALSLLLLAILILVQGGELRPVAGLVATGFAFRLALGLVMFLGLRAWWRLLSSPVHASPWVVLGGRPGLLVLRLVASQAMLGAVLIGATIPRRALPNTLLLASVWWVALMVGWLAMCLLLGSLLRRTNRRTFWRTSREGVEWTVATVGVVVVLAFLDRQINGWPLAFATALVALSGVHLVRTLLSHERVTLRIATPEGAPDSRPATSGGVRPLTSLRRIGAMLVVRTMGWQLGQTVTFVGLVGIVIVGGMIRKHDVVPAAALAFVGFGVAILSLASMLRTQVGKQHVFLQLCRVGTFSGVWRQLVTGELLVFGGAALILALVMAVANLPTARVPLFVVPPVEWSVYVALAAHLWGPRLGADNASRAAAMLVTALVALALVTAKALVVGWLVPWLVPIQSAASALVVATYTVRAPLRIQGKG